jgi:PadR family transcriptional regulator PadR
MHLGDFEEVVLLAILALGENAYGVPIRARLEDAGRKTSVGALYVTFDRLETKGLVESWEGEATPQRGGRAKKYFRVTGAGQDALRQTEATRVQLRGGLRLVGGVA